MIFSWYYVVKFTTGEKRMNGVQISQVRWPVELYQWLQDRAYKKRQSINKTVIEIVETVRSNEEADSS